MTPQDPLADLHPLRTPSEIGWWPMAPGWWVLLGVAILLLLAAIYGWYRHRARNAYRRTALRQLIELNPSEEQSLFLSQLNALLKSVAVHAFPRRNTAALSGQAWLEFLNTSCPKPHQNNSFPAAFSTAVYRADPTSLDKAKLLQASRYWIKNHRATL